MTIILPDRVNPSDQSERLVAARVRGVDVQIPCPDWCTLDHVQTNEGFIEDVHHEGQHASLAAPVYGGDTEKVLIADVRYSPFSGRGDSRPYLCLSATDGSDCAELSPEQALAFADQLVAHAETIRRLAAGLQGGAR